MYEEEQALVGVQAWKERSLIDLLHFRRLTKGDNPIFLFLGDGESVTSSLSAEALHRQASRAAAHLARTLPAGSRVILLFENGLEYIIGFFACLYAGHVPVSGVYPSAIGARERFIYILEDSQAQAVLGKKETLHLFHADGDTTRPVKWIPLESALKSSREIEPVASTSEQLALVQYTSGSTEEPKGVCLSHRNICHNIHAQLISFQYQDDDTGLSWLPFTHDMGLVGAVLPALAAGNPFYFMAPDKFIEKPSRWLEAIHRYGATISGGPDFAYRYASRLSPGDIAPGWDFSRWKIAFNGSESINPETLDAFFNTFKSHGFKKEAFYSCYGLAENALLVTSGVKGAGVKLWTFDRLALTQGKALPATAGSSQDTTTLASCGTTHEDQHVHIVDPDTHAFLPEGCIGEIWIDSPSVSIGYLNNPLHNARSFITIENRRYLRTQDFGFLYKQELFHVGRLSEKFSYDGNVYYTNDIALSLSQSLAGALCMVVPPSLPERALPVLIIECENTPDASALRAAIVETMKRYRIQLFEYFAIRKGFVIRTPSGKQRADLTLANILTEKTAILLSGDTHSPVATSASLII
ncbi:AMP-binding protein [Asaia siamensis]|uniref:Fatty acyl-AMP ligase n=1 Tax=Asaia siamensis TaxID=110479 RepID=A0ABQ1L830_9PROT|nr:AMP-binding protein [Asaia siamensis]GBR09415.1 acyl-CoA synthetase [Asaia siamensis NRIC 0323]GGC20078.1 fatty acyl-AMP ligase [Asaia siamensis]